MLDSKKVDFWLVVGTLPQLAKDKVFSLKSDYE